MGIGEDQKTDWRRQKDKKTKFNGRKAKERKTKRQNLMGERPRRGRKYEEDRKAERTYFFDAVPLNYLYKAGLLIHLT